MITETLKVTGLTPEQIEQIKIIIEAFKAKNQLDCIQNITKSESSNVNNEEINISDLFFSSEILVPFERSTLYTDIEVIKPE